MKHLITVVLLTSIIFLLICCKKDSEKTIKIEVVEYKTNSPIADATLDFNKPGNFDLNCLCWPNENFLTKQTDANGVCSITETESNQAINGVLISKENYWGTGSSSIQNKYELDLIGKIRMHIIQTSSYPDQATMSFSCNGERLSSVTGISNFILPVDSTFTFNVFGGQTNTITWTVYAPTGSPVITSGMLHLDVSRSGIVDTEIKY